MDKNEINFLRESNAIEGVLDEDSLTQAMFAWDFLKEQKRMSAHVMLKTHKTLMLHSNLSPNEKGYFRQVPVYIGGHEAPSYYHTEAQLDLLIKQMNLNPKHWKRHHIEYEKIHPFVDGNGRTGRMFLNWERLKVGMPIKIIKAKERMRYYEWFH